MSCGLATALLTMAVAGAAVAQQAPHPPAAPRPAPGAAPAAQGEAPQQTTATYGDWVLQCVTNTNPPSQEVCDMAQVTQVQGKNLPFSRIAIAHPEKGQPVKLVAQVPVNASFGTSVHIQTSDDEPGIIAPFTNCIPNGCFAEFALNDDMLKKLRAASGVGKLSFADAGAHPLSVPIAFNGFGQAFDALSKK